MQVEQERKGEGIVGEAGEGKWKRRMRGGGREKCCCVTPRSSKWGIMSRYSVLGKPLGRDLVVLVCYTVARKIILRVATRRVAFLYVCKCVIYSVFYLFHSCLSSRVLSALVNICNL